MHTENSEVKGMCGVESITKSDTYLFYSYLIFIVILPLPFGGDWPWAMGMYETMVLLMSAVCLWLYIKGSVELSLPFKKARIAHVFLVMWLLYLGIQILPGMGLTTTASLNQISVSPHITASGWLMSLVYVQLFMLTLVLVNSRKRIKLLAGIIVFCGVFQAMYGSLMTLSGLEYSFFIKKIT